jgi:hypothetical protein
METVVGKAYTLAGVPDSGYVLAFLTDRVCVSLTAESVSSRLKAQIVDVALKYRYAFPLFPSSSTYSHYRNPPLCRAARSAPT